MRHHDEHKANDDNDMKAPCLLGAHKEQGYGHELAGVLALFVLIPKPDFCNLAKC